jgi:hypothetical protein
LHKLNRIETIRIFRSLCILFANRSILFISITDIYTETKRILISISSV